MSKTRFFKSIFILMMVWSNARCQSIDYSVHANIVYHITKYIEWPENKRTGDFVIGIIGDSPLFDHLKSLSINKSVNGQKIIIKNISASSNDVLKCQILFISEEENHSVKRIAANSEGMPVLIITESEGLALKGSCINFIIEDDHLKLEINKKNIESKNIKIASELMSLGKLVQ
jgi:YfiR/HmsC-like